MPSAAQIQWISSSVAAVLAGLVAIGATVAIEKLGGLLGGVIASTPTTIVPSLLGLTFSGAKHEDIFVFSMNVPPPLVLNSGVLLVWRLINERLPSGWSKAAKLGTLILSVLIFWFVGAAFIVLGLERGLQIRPIVLGFSFLVIHVIFGVTVLLSTYTSSPKGANKVSAVILALRGFCAMTTIFIGSIIARTHPSAGGFVSCFPAIYLTTMISVWISQGDKVASGATGPMVLGGLSVSLFAAAYGLLLPTFGWISSTIMSYLIAVLGWSIPLAFFLRWWSSRLAPPPALLNDSSELSVYPQKDPFELEVSPSNSSNEDTSERA
jgi:hypothetical protein